MNMTSHWLRNSILILTLLISSLAMAAESKDSLRLQHGLYHAYPAPEIEGITDWINSPPLKLANLKGKVVLVDFWTYSCINCIRTLPYLKEWYNKYHQQGLVIIGVHAPEFAFEKNLQNVKNAVVANGIHYPVALDNQFVTWRNYNNQYWPAHYLIDKKGLLVYQHFGEGEYDVTENNIRFLLGMNQPAAVASEPDATFSFSQTPETYLGYARAENFSGKQPVVHDKAALYLFPDEIEDNNWALNGEWRVNEDKIISVQPNVELKIKFNARKVYMVMGNVSKRPIKVKLLLNGEPVVTGKGKDVVASSITVDKHKLYEILDLSQFETGILQVTPEAPGLEIYTFTFG